MDEFRLGKTNIIKLKQIFQYIPNDFTSIPLHIFNVKDKYYAQISTLTPSFNLAFSSIINLDNDGLNNNFSELYVRMPLNKNVINQLFNTSFNEIIINQTKCIGKNKNKEIEIVMYDLDDSDIEMTKNLPFTNEDIYNSIIKNNENSNLEKIIVDLNVEMINDIISCYSVLQSKKNEVKLKIKSTKHSIIIESKDTIDNKFSYKINIDNNANLSSLFSNLLLNVLVKCKKFNDDINVLFSDLIICITYKNNGIIVTYAIPSNNDE